MVSTILILVTQGITFISLSYLKYMVITIALYRLMEHERAIFLTTSRICAGAYWGMLSSNLQIHVCLKKNMLRPSLAKIIPGGEVFGRLQPRPKVQTLLWSYWEGLEGSNPARITWEETELWGWREGSVFPCVPEEHLHFFLEPTIYMTKSWSFF